MNFWWIKLVRYAVPQWRGLLLVGVLTLTGIALGLLTPWPMKLIVDYVLQRQALPERLALLTSLPGAGSSTGLLGWLAAATILLFVASKLVSLAGAYVRAGVGSRMVYHLATDLFDHLQQQSLKFHHQHRAGDLIRRVTADTGCVRELVLNVYLPVLTSLVTLVAMFVVMWQLNSALALFAALLIVPLIVLVKLFARPMGDRRYREWQMQGELTSMAEQVISALPVVQAFGQEEFERQRFREGAERCIRASLQSEWSQQQFQLSTGLITALGTAIVMTVGGFSVLEGRLSVGSLLVLIAYFAALYSPIETLAYLSEGFASAAAGARRVFEILAAKDAVDPEPVSAREGPTPNRGDLSIRFDRVTVGYEPNRPVLTELSLTIEPGETVALVGPSGGGKSTLVSLLPRLIDPWSGSIYFGDAETGRMPKSEVRQQVAMVLQEPFLLPLSIAENIAYARPGASREEVIAAATAANADQFIKKLSAGYDTIIGEKGLPLSGGERQRIAIARALLKDAPILILDEPTAALDVQTEASLIEALERLMTGRTTLIIAHRLTTIRRADRIIVLDQGKIVEMGRHTDLIAAQGLYASFWQANQATEDDNPFDQSSAGKEGVVEFSVSSAAQKTV